MSPNPRIVVTGGPGSGKTALIAALSAQGFRTAPEAGRAVILEQQQADGEGLPWRDRQLFARLMLERDIASHERASAGTDPVFFDRGLPDIAGYLRLCGLPVPPEVDRAARERRYGDPVFIAPFWPEIFVNNAERRQDADEARRTFETMQAVYPFYGYRLIELPRDTVAARVAFVLRHSVRRVT